MPVRAFIGSDEVTDYLTGFDAPRIGPGVVGSGTLYLDKAAGGLDLRFGEEVKVYRTFNDAGAGVADRGRYFFGIVADRETTNVVNIKQWAIPCFSYNILTVRLVRDANADKAIALSAGTFSAQVAALIETIQENGNGAVAKTIDATTHVANLYGSMPAVALPPGKSLGWYLAYLGHTVRTLNPAVYPAFFMDTLRDFGVATSAGGATLHFYDASLMPSPLYTYANDPTGAERTWYEAPRRILSGSSVVNRRQLTFQDSELIATYAETASGSTYPNQWINHGLTGDTGYWMAEPVDDGEVSHWQDAEAAIRGEVQKTAYPRETVELAVAEQLYVGDVVTIINDLEGISQDMRVVESKVDWSFDAVDPGSIIRCGARLLRMGEDSEEIPVPPTEGDVTPPGQPTWAGAGAWILQNEQEPGNYAGVTFEAQTTLAEPGDMSHYWWRYAFGTNPSPDPNSNDWTYVRTEAADKTLLIEDAPFSTLVTVYVKAFDTAGNGSLESVATTAVTADQRFWEYPPNLHFEQHNPNDGPDAATHPWGWTATENGLSTARLHTSDRHDGLSSLRLFHDGSNTPSVMGGLFPVSDNAVHTYNWAGYVKGQTAGDDIVFRVYWYDENGVTTGNTAAGTVDLTTSWAQFSLFVDSPGLGARWASLHIGGGALGVSKWGLVDAMNFMVQVTGDQLSPELVYSGALIIDPADGEQLQFRDNEANIVGGIAGSGTVAGGNRQVILGASDMNADVALFAGRDITLTSLDDILLQATDDIAILASDTMSIDAFNGITFPGFATFHGSLINGNAALATTATDGFLYVRTCAGKPTGTPTTRVGTVPVVWDTTNRVFWMYSAGAWLPLEGINTSFPASPITGQKFYRSDLQRWAFYDGTRWVSEKVALPLHNYLGTPPYSADTEALAGGVPGDFAFLVERFDVGWYTGIDQDASNNWTIRLRRLTSGSSVDTIKDLNTHPDSAGNWNKVSGNSGFTNNPMNASDIWLQVYLVKTGSPGNIYIQASVTGRFVLA